MRLPEYTRCPLVARAQLKDDARRPIADIADMVEAPTKTMRRHLEDMISDGSLEMQIPADFPSGEMAEIRWVLTEANEDEDAMSVVPNLVYLERIYSTWRDRLPEVQRRPSKKASAHKARPELRME